jgi:hypothetical protein
VARVQAPTHRVIPEGKHWTWFARQDRFRSHEVGVAALYDYTDKAFDRFCDAWCLEPPKDKYTLQVMACPGGGFAAGDITEVRSITGKESPE